MQLSLSHWMWQLLRRLEKLQKLNPSALLAFPRADSMTGTEWVVEGRNRLGPLANGVCTVYSRVRTHQ